jgi:hypothetical protein
LSLPHGGRRAVLSVIGVGLAATPCHDYRITRTKVQLILSS